MNVFSIDNKQAMDYLTSLIITLSLIILGWKFIRILAQKNVWKHGRKRFENKVVLITGANSGLGEKLTEAFYLCGAKVIMAARRMDDMQRVCQQLTRLEPTGELTGVCLHQPQLVQLDLEQNEKIADVVHKQIVPIHGHVDVIINNAGITSRASVLESDFDKVHQRVMKVNYFSQIIMVKELLPQLLERNSGQIVCISSVQGRIALPYRSAYSASKHALQAYYDSLRAELFNTNISVIVASPGYIQTNISLNAVNADGSKYGQMDANTAKGYTPAQVAEEILLMMVNREAEQVIAPLVPRLMVIVRTLLPSIYHFAMRIYARNR